MTDSETKPTRTTRGPLNLAAATNTCTCFDVLTRSWIAGGTHRETDETFAARTNTQRALVRQDVQSAYFWMYELVSKVAGTGQTAAA